jgi:hypothetical protein
LRVVSEPAVRRRHAGGTRWRVLRTRAGRGGGQSLRVTGLCFGAFGARSPGAGVPPDGSPGFPGEVELMGMTSGRTVGGLRGRGVAAAAARSSVRRAEGAVDGAPGLWQEGDRFRPVGERLGTAAEKAEVGLAGATVGARTAVSGGRRLRRPEARRFAEGPGVWCDAGALRFGRRTSHGHPWGRRQERTAVRRWS